jgi:signal transduction histidine kinase
MIVGYLAVVYNPLLRLALPSDATDPWEWRVALSLLYTFNCTMALTVPMYRRWFKEISYVTYYLTSAWLIWLLYANDFRHEYMLHYLLSVFIQFPLFYKVRDLVYFGAFHGILTAIAALSVDPLLISPYYLVLLVAGLFIAGVLPLAFRMRLDESLEAGKRLQRLINKTVMHSSEEGIFVVDTEGKPLASNLLLQTMWNIPDHLFRPDRLEEAMAHVSMQVVQPEILTQLISRAKNAPESRVKGVLPLRNGNFLQARSEPLWQDGKRIGMVWYYRDITPSVRRETELADQNRRTQQFNLTLQALAASRNLKAGDLNAFFEELTSTTADLLRLDRLGIWTYARNEEVLVMQKQFNRSHRNFLEGVEFQRSKHPAYFNALSKERLLIIPNTLDDDRISPYVSTFAPSTQARSLMDAPIVLQGEMVGILCADNNGGNTVWTEQEQHFFLSVADLVSLSMEVSRRVKVEEKLAHNLALLKSVFDTMGSGILVADLNRNVLDYNSQYLQIWNLTPALLQGPADDVIRFCNEQLKERERVMEEFKGVLNHPDYNGTELLEFKDGRVAERLVRPLIIGDEIAGRIFVYRDITQKVRADLALAESERKNKAILDALPDIIIRIDAQGDILDYKVPADMEDYLPGRIHADATMVQLVQGSVGERLLIETRAAMETGQPGFFESPLSEDENAPVLEARIVPNGPQEALVVLRDITSRKRSERELVKRNFELDSFVYRASHDLKAPLNSVMGLIQIALQEEDPVKLKPYLHLMDKSVVKLDTFIRNLNEFTRITRLELRREEVDLPLKVQEILDSLQFLEHRDRPTIEVNCKIDAPFLTDPFHLEIVLTNLISNAIKYQDFSKPASWIRFEAHVGPSESVIKVSDNGMGIPAAHLDKIFSLFFRATNQSFGSGIGLYITENAVRKMGGRVEVSSTEKEGTTFTLHLPNGQPAEPAA